jgi:hypothetical protein
VTDKEVMQMALDALEKHIYEYETIQALRAALAQPEKEWQGLTKEELAEISEFHFHGALSGREFYDDIEAKLKEKNG